MNFTDIKQRDFDYQEPLLLKVKDEDGVEEVVYGYLCNTNKEGDHFNAVTKDLKKL